MVGTDGKTIVDIKQIEAKIAAKIYPLISSFEEICGQGIYSSNKLQSIKALSTLGSSPAECEAIFDKFKMEREERG